MMGRSLLSSLPKALAIFAGCLSLASALPSDTEPAKWPQQMYKSSSIKTPVMNVTKMGPTEPGFLFITPSDKVSKIAHPAIYSDDGQLVWQGVPGNYSALQPQILDGEPVIAFWEGVKEEGFGFGHISILNSSYDEIHRVTLNCKKENFVTSMDSSQLDSCIDIHESQFTADGTILVTAVNVTRGDLTPVGGPKDGWIQDGIVYEIDIKTNKIVFRWSAYEHPNEAPMNYDRAPLGAKGAGSGVSRNDPYGYPHLNSVYKYGNSYLVSSRYMCSIFFLASDGGLIWHLHGRTGGDFQLEPDISFCYQHDPRFESQSAERVTVSLHNNDNTEFTPKENVTTGLVLDVELQGSKAVKLKKRMWDKEEPVYSQSQGGFQVIGNGHTLQDHGAVPKIEEYAADGTIVMRARFGHDTLMQSYRAYRYPWAGRPHTKPDVAACPSGENGKTAVYVSWNGATDVESWMVYSGSQVKKAVSRGGFETTILIDDISTGNEVVVEAVGGVGDGTRSKPVTVSQSC